MIDEALVDQIKITVIATGFDETRQRLRDISGRATTKPALETVVNDQTGDDKKEFTEPQDNTDTELDIPAFLRQGR